MFIVSGSCVYFYARIMRRRGVEEIPIIFVMGFIPGQASSTNYNTDCPIKVVWKTILEGHTIRATVLWQNILQIYTITFSVPMIITFCLQINIPQIEGIPLLL